MRNEWLILYLIHRKLCILNQNDFHLNKFNSVSVKDNFSDGLSTLKGS